LSLKDTATTAWEDEKVLLVQRRAGEHQACLICSLGDNETVLSLPLPPGRWRKQLDTAAARWFGSGQEAPEILNSIGEVEFTVSPRTCTLWVRTELTDNERT
jgi:hypothetical protein